MQTSGLMKRGGWGNPQPSVQKQTRSLAIARPQSDSLAVLFRPGEGDNFKGGGKSFAARLSLFPLMGRARFHLETSAIQSSPLRNSLPSSTRGKIVSPRIGPPHSSPISPREKKALLDYGRLARSEMRMKDLWTRLKVEKDFLSSLVCKAISPSSPELFSPFSLSHTPPFPSGIREKMEKKRANAFSHLHLD